MKIKKNRVTGKLTESKKLIFGKLKMIKISWFESMKIEND